ncbi:DUF4097 family beta strand repeat-containing protein [Streptomyces sp. NBC_01022]|uniref:DUF4097 family beta strand repeat-containing protein n=1 Tax=Streptomyces sp. NBC_01022 TaxID=2903723 RepID=UPI002DDC8B66|nr:DUF4097 family beta strand repeat-containing protein [Streptomyces sp. NBC_01022]WRZ87600.1 DUF4097 domain-containing protein [Streptomyces sp. NBC_01022]
MQKFETPAPVRAILDIPAGRVRVVAAEQADTTVDILPADASRKRDVKTAEKTTTVYDDGVLRIETPANSSHFSLDGALDVTIHLPAGSRIEAKAGSAEFHTAGPLGHVAFHGAHSTTKIDHAAGLELTANAGNVTVGYLGGDGEVSVTQGDITIAEAVHGTLTLRTVSGNVTVAAARTTSATLDATTTHGRIHNSLANAQGPRPDLTIHATTTNGNITARTL